MKKIVFWLAFLPLLHAADAPVLKPDHAILSASAEQEARALLQKFTDDLGLIAAWPFQQHGARMSGGILLGNFVLEIAVWPQVEPYQLLGLALEVRDTNSAYEELRSRGFTVKVQDREPGFFEIATVSQLAGEGLGIFLCKPNPAWHRNLQARGGLPGVRGVTIEIGVNAARREDLGKLLAPNIATSLDPPIEVVDGRYQIRALKIRCEKPELAIQVLPKQLPLVFVR